MRTGISVLSVCAALLSLEVCVAFGQETGPRAAALSSLTPSALRSGGRPSLASSAASIAVIVADEVGTPLQGQAVVKLYSEKARTQTWGTTNKKSEAEFRSVAPGDYELEASAGGYETATKSLDVTSEGQVRVVSIKLKRNADLKVGPLLSPDVMRRVRKGLDALGSGRLEVARKELESAYRAAPTNADFNFLLGFLSEEERDSKTAESYFVKAVSFDPRAAHALISLGQLREDRGDYAGAVAPLEKAVSINRDHWLAHWLLASAYLQQRQFTKARDEAEFAIRTGKGAGRGAEAIRGLALAYLGYKDEAIAVLSAFLRDEPGDPAAPAIRQALAQLQGHPSDSRELAGPLPVRTSSPLRGGCK